MTTQDNLAVGEHTRYRMLESIRDYGRERLPELGIADTAHAAHADVVDTALQVCQSDLSAERFSIDLDELRRGWTTPASP